MTPKIDHFLKLFFPGYTISSVRENDVEFDLNLSASLYTSTDPSQVESSFSFLIGADSFTFSVTFGSSDAVPFNSADPNFAQFKQSLDEEYTYNQTPILGSFRIVKQKVGGKLAIYDMAFFLSTMRGLTVSQAFTVFSRALSGESVLRFKVAGLRNRICTETMCCLPDGDEFNLAISVNREKIVDDSKIACYFTDIDEIRLIPDDFNIIEDANDEVGLKDLFLFYRKVLSIIFLFDITTLHQNELEFKINGYKTIKGTIDLTAISCNDSDEYYSIYKWVYTGGNLSDKIGIARNILSLNFDNIQQLSLQRQPFQAIKSSYKVYEKQNIKQYIEIRNKISDQLLDFNNRANKLIETFASGFQKSSLALITFYISAIALKVLGKSEFINVFTLDATILSLAFLAGSFIYFRVSRWEVVEQRKRFSDSYANMKTRYTDLLDQNDIERILNNDREYLADLNFINSKLRVYSKMWIGIICILGLATVTLFCFNNISEICSTPLLRLLFRLCR